MIASPHATRILCYGDSNTWGQMPHTKGRFDESIRWTAVMQHALGNGFEVIEEGLPSRTTNLEYAKKPGRNGKEYFRPCAESHKPLDLVLIMLGTNDFKIEFGPRPIQDIVQALGTYVEDIQAYVKNRHGAPTRVALVSPIHIDGQAQSFHQIYESYYDERSVQASHRIAKPLADLAAQTGAYFADASEVARAGEDGIHLDAQSHKELGMALAGKIKEWMA